MARDGLPVTVRRGGVAKAVAEGGIGGEQLIADAGETQGGGC